MEILTGQIRAVTARRRHRKLRQPEYRALAQIMAEAEAEGRQVVVLSPAGILEVVGSSAFRREDRSNPRKRGTPNDEGSTK
jgi:hypothetical protein